MMGSNIDSDITTLLESIRAYKPEKVILFGSSAKGENDEYSDIDLVIIKKTKKDFLERLREVALMLNCHMKRADLFVYTPEEFDEMKEKENPFIEQVISEGKVIYEKQ